ncbi:hypothetical protein AJ79_07373 [Helicocarpus griseus UAMH5409]|uniref:Zn(2)-C6 fungal-type domain-containing protein n=1 Tax=Helicocarpus griseus UAMH5409 TaxID=1447875 RepID=A0A2B7X3S5_9EURO|nr:hypothetical protein AJ79_07373 [Helicocarpus griseus UAMH5409]
MAARTAGPSSTANNTNNAHARQPRDSNSHSNPGFSSPRRSPSPAAPQHRRGYQACDPCRKRKVRCDLGSVDNPRPPPCVRCRRESKRCEFSATRRKRKVSEAADNYANGDDDDPALRRDKRMMSADASRFDSNNDTNNSSDASPFHPASVSVSSATAADTDNISLSSQHRRWTEPAPIPAAPARISVQPYPAPPPPADVSQYSNNSRGHIVATAARGTGYAENGRPAGTGQMMNRTAAELLSPAISNTHDALHLLSEAAGRTEDLNRQQQMYAARHSSTSTFTSTGSPIVRASSPGKSVRSLSNAQQPGHRFQHHAPGSVTGGGIDQRVAEGVGGGGGVGTGGGAGLLTAAAGIKGGYGEDVEYTNAARAWSRFRFIRAGWFSVDEAMGYIAYYYEHLAPLSPIVVPNFSSPATHLTLLTEEPVLTLTMLTIASRHMPLTGNGSNSRAYSIHEKLWSYLRGMIERLFWGQEKFDGGTLPSQMHKFSFAPGQSNASSGHLRSLGTIEALLLLTDWHPRALHFPPGDDENTLLDIDPQLLTQIADNKMGADHDHDTMTGKAQSGGGGGGAEGRLAFYKWLEPVWRSDRMSWMLLSTAQALAFELGVFDPKHDQLSNSTTESSAERIRKRRVRRLILVYVSQSSGRLGIPSMLPLPQWGINMDPISAEESRMLDPNEDRSIDLMQDCWMDISKIMYTSNQVLFQSKEQTSNLIKSGRYREQIDRFMPSLREFKVKFDRVSMPAHMRHILAIEYEYTRLYVNCLALQAVVDRWTTMSNEVQNTPASARPSSGAGAPSSSTAATASWRVLMEQYQVNEPYIQEVVDASRRILKTVLDGLVPGDSLKHAPVRTFFRILSGMIFILKTFTLGAKADEVRISLDLQDRTVESLRTCVVDDVHLSVTIADLLQLLTSNIRNRFLRFAPPDRVPGECSSRERTPQPQSQPLVQSPTDHHHHNNLHSAPQQDHTHNNGDFQTPAKSSWPQHHQLPNNNSAFAFDTTPTNNNAAASTATTATTPSTTSDPLANIPTLPLNSSNLTVNFMPPPASVYYNYYDPATASMKMDLDGASDQTIAPEVISNNTNGSGNTNNEESTAGAGVNGNATGGSSDWFALPLDQLFNNATMGVDQGLGGTGPMVGEFDMLEVLLKEQDDGAW